MYTFAPWSYKKRVREIQLHRQSNLILCDQEVCPMHGNVPLFIVVEYSFGKISIMTSNLYIWTRQYIKGNTVFFHNRLAEQVLGTFYGLGLLIHHMRVSLF